MANFWKVGRKSILTSLLGPRECERGRPIRSNTGTQPTRHVASEISGRESSATDLSLRTLLKLIMYIDAREGDDGGNLHWSEQLELKSCHPIFRGTERNSCPDCDQLGSDLIS